MRVLLAIPCLMRGGTEMQSLYHAKALLSGGYTVDVVCYFEFDKGVVDDFRQAGCTVSLLHLKRGGGKSAFISVMKDFYRASRPDVLHVQYMTPGALSIIAARLAGLTTILATVHQPYTRAHGLMALILLRASALLCTKFFAVSKAAERSWFGSSNDCEKQLRFSRHCTIHNAVDTQRVAALSGSVQAAVLKQHYRFSDVFVFGYIGRLSHEKGVDILFEAFGKLAQRRNGIRLLVVGDGEEKAELERTFGSEIWWSSIAFAGKQTWETAMAHLAAMDAVVVPSRFEGFGLSAVEAMAAAKPVIASDTGGLSEIVRHGKSGLVFQNGDVTELAGLMDELVENASLRNLLAEDAKKCAETYDISVYEKKIISYYNKLKKA